MRPRWVVASGVGLAQMLAFGTSLYLLTVLSQPIRMDTGWPLPWIFGGMSAGQLAGAAAAPRVGRWIRRLGGRPALSVSSLLFAAGLALLAVSTSLPVYFAGWVVIGLAMACGLYDVAFGALGRLYGLEARRAITTVTLWGGFASTVFWTLSGLLVSHVGWRLTCGIYAGLHLVVALPIYRWLLPAAEPHVEPQPDGSGSGRAADLPVADRPHRGDAAGCGPDVRDPGRLDHLGAPRHPAARARPEHGRGHWTRRLHRADPGQRAIWRIHVRDPYPSEPDHGGGGLRDHPGRRPAAVPAAQRGGGGPDVLCAPGSGWSRSAGGPCRSTCSAPWRRR